MKRLVRISVALVLVGGGLCLAPLVWFHPLTVLACLSAGPMVVALGIALYAFCMLRDLRRHDVL